MKSAGLLSFCAILILFALGALFPQQFWGVNFLAFFDSTVVMGVLVICPFIVFALGKKQLTRGRTSGNAYAIRLTFTALAMLLFWQFPIALDRYGDAFGIRPQLDYAFEEWDTRLLTELLKFNYFDPKVGAETFFSFISLTSFLFQVNCFKALVGIEIISLGLFIWFWNSLVFEKLDSWHWRISMMLVGASAPLLLVFQDHAEIYAMPITFVMGYMVLVAKVENGSVKWPWLFVALLVGIKLHFLLYLLLPMSAVVSLRKRTTLTGIVESAISSKGVIQWLVPVGLIVICLFYFVYQGGIEGQRTYSSDDLYSALLLPIKATEGPPFDRYVLLSSAHILDTLNVLLFWSPAVWMILIITYLSKTAHLDFKWVSILAMTLAAYVAIQFIQNPLLGLTIDIDLYSLPAPIFLTLGIALCSTLEKESTSLSIPVGIGVIALLSFSSFVVRANDSALSQQFEVVGKHHFKTYWLGGSSPIQYAMELEKDKDAQLVRLNNVIAELEPYSVAGVDEEFAEILRTTGRVYQDSFADVASAIPYYKRAFAADPLLRKGVFDLTIAYFLAGRTQESADLVSQLIKVEYPSTTKAIRIGIHICLAAGRNQAALNYATDYVQNWPEDEGISWALELMEAGKWSEALRTFRTK